MQEIDIIQKQRTKDFSQKEYLQEKLSLFLKSHQFRHMLTCVVIFDMCLVMTDLGCTLFYAHKTIPHNIHQFQIGLSYVSLGVLCIFMIEILTQFVCHGIKWIQNFVHVLDIFVVLTSFIFDCYEISIAHQDSSEIIIEIIVVMRLWRIARIAHALNETKNLEFKNKSEELKKENKLLEHENNELKKNIQQLQQKLNAALQQIQQLSIEEYPEIPEIHNLITNQQAY